VNRSAAIQGRASVWDGPLAAIGRIPARLRSAGFWQIQAISLGMIAVHYALVGTSIARFGDVRNDLSFVLYVIPVLLAALLFRWEGALMTALWLTLLTLPSFWLFSSLTPLWSGQTEHLALWLVVALIVAWRVAREAEARSLAERANTRLALLNNITRTLSHSEQLEPALEPALRLLCAELPLDSAVLTLVPEAPGVPSRFVALNGPRDGEPQARSPEEPRRDAVATRVDAASVFLPVGPATAPAGSLLATAPAGTAMDDDQVRLLELVVREIAASIENARLRDRRQVALQTYARAVTKAQEDERRRIARDLHDDTLQELVVLTRKVERCAGRADRATSDALDEIVVGLRGIGQAVRRFSRDLRPAVLDDLGLLPALEMMGDEAVAWLPGGITLDVHGEPYRLDTQVELALFRIAQEALRNVKTHSQATAATLELTFGDDAVSLALGDNGLGCAERPNIADLVRNGHLGLMGMQERIALVGGALDLDSTPGGGFRVVARVAGGHSALDLAPSRAGLDAAG